MQNDWRIRSVVVALAAVAAATVFAQWPFALPLLGISPETEPAQTQRNGKVNLSGDAVPARQVFEQLRQAGANFVIDSDAVPADKKLSLNLVNQDPESAVKAVAKALGMSADKEGEILILSPGPSFAWRGMPFGEDSEGPAHGLAPFGSWKGDMKMPDGTFQFDWDSKDAPEALPKILENLKDAKIDIELGKIGDMLDLKLGEPLELAKLVKSLTPAQLDLHKKQGYLKLGDLNPEQRKWLGNLGENKGEFEVTFAEGDKKVTIRSK